MRENNSNPPTLILPIEPSSIIYTHIHSSRNLKQYLAADTCMLP